MRRANLATIGLVTFLLLSVMPMITNGVPPIPSDYQGCVKVDGELAPDGTIVYAKISNGTATYTSNSVSTENGYYDNLVVAPPDESFEGKTINFYVKPPGKSAKIAGTSTFYGGRIDQEVNLEYTTETGPSPPENRPPVQPSQPNPEDGETGISLSVTLSWYCYDPDGDIVSYVVYFGLSPSSLEKIAHNITTKSCDVSNLQYSTTYYWKVVAWDPHGAKSEGPIWEFTTKSKPSPPSGGGGGGTPSPPPENHPPSAPSKPSGSTSGYVNQSYSYSTSSTDPDGDQIKYGWDWDGDGNVDEWTGFYNSGETITLSHSWSQPGTYQIKVKAMDQKGDESEWSESLTVTILTSTKKPPVAVISAPDAALVNQTISLDASHSSDPDGTIVNYTWDFGDGNTGYGVAVTHSYSLPGNYTITLTVTDNDNLANSTTHTIWIQPDSDNDGWSDHEEKTYGTDPYNASSYPKDTDSDRIPDPVDPDDDDDGLNDTMEQEIGSPQDNANEYVEPIVDGKTTYLVDTDNDGIYDTFYDPETNTKTSVEQNEEGRYLIDSDGDGVVDYVYDPTSGAINPYEKPTKPIEISWSIVVSIIVALLVIVGIVYLYKRGKI